MKILIVEDDYLSRTFMKHYLGRFGTCDVAVDGFEAIKKVEEAMDNDNHYDLICLDVMMPKVDGIKVLKNIRDCEDSREKRGICPARIIITSALKNKALIEESDKYGCDGYVWKPIIIESFNELLEKLNLI